MIECVDLFCGAGGLSLGLASAGIVVRVAVDADRDCEKTYTHNFPSVRFLRESVQDISIREIKAAITPGAHVVLAGGPPCQLFSRLNRNGSDDSPELAAYIRIIKQILPDIVLLENVPAIQDKKRAWSAIMGALSRLGYHVDYRVLRAVDFGVAQKRERLFILGCRRAISLPMPKRSVAKTVRMAIGHLPDSNKRIPNHYGMCLSSRNLKRIRNLGAGENSRGATDQFRDSYARMAWDEPAPTVTTKCISFSNGRFGHPVFDRAITLREAACLQGFPAKFVFFGNLWSCARQIGNAVPPPMARKIGKRIVEQLSGGIE
jgi:DNA (cytosine-5)-methyltransferase 1